MVDEIMVCVDRIIASAACFQESSSATVGSNGGVKEEGSDVACENGGLNGSKGGTFSGDVDEGSSFSSVKLKGCVQECRICQEEAEEKEMEAPCACNGTLKFAHRKCIQKWCNKKGDIICEICNQVFSPNYTSPPPRSNADVMTIDIRQAWGPHIDLRDPRLLALAASEHQFLESDYDSYAIANSGTLACFRSVGIIQTHYYGYLIYAVDANLVGTPNINDHKRLWDVPGVISFLPLSDLGSSAGWFSPSLLRGGPFMVHSAVPKEEAGLKSRLMLHNSLLEGNNLFSNALGGSSGSGHCTLNFLLSLNNSFI